MYFQTKITTNIKGKVTKILIIEQIDVVHELTPL